MNINLSDPKLLAFLKEILENESLTEIFSRSEYWQQGGEDALKLLSYSKFQEIPQEIKVIITKLLEDICPEECEICCIPIGWDQMAYTLLNGDNLCDFHHNSKKNLETD